MCLGSGASVWGPGLSAHGHAAECWERTRTRTSSLLDGPKYNFNKNSMDVMKKYPPWTPAVTELCSLLLDLCLHLTPPAPENRPAPLKLSVIADSSVMQSCRSSFKKAIRYYCRIQPLNMKAAHNPVKHGLHTETQCE